MDGEQIKVEGESFIEAIGLGIILHIALVLLILVAYSMFVRNHWRALVVVTAIVLWVIIAASRL